jgi:hypothetical protein
MWAVTAPVWQIFNSCSRFFDGDVAKTRGF